MSRSFGASRFTTRLPILDGAGRNALEPRDHSQERGLAAARGSNQNHEIAVRDVKRNAVNDFVPAIALADIDHVD